MFCNPSRPDAKGNGKKIYSWGMSGFDDTEENITIVVAQSYGDTAKNVRVPVRSCMEAEKLQGNSESCLGVLCSSAIALSLFGG